MERTLSIDYVGDMLEGAAFDDLHDRIVDIFVEHGLTVDGMSDGPTARIGGSDG